MRFLAHVHLKYRKYINMKNYNVDQIDEGAGKYISIGLIASLMSIPSLFGANTV